ncbi:hypothetical protein BN130_841 [Cronobacter malonaticus 507]|nr:hypothetical protein BN130_841 [Cronobacter malonaticus 507]
MADRFDNHKPDAEQQALLSVLRSGAACVVPAFAAAWNSGVSSRCVRR